MAAHLVPGESTDELSVLVSNPHKIPLSINRNAGIAFLKIVSNKDVISAYSIGSLSDLGLPTPEDSSVIASILKDEQIGNITPTEKEQFLQLVHKYKHLFAETNAELGCAHNCFHKVDTGDAPPLFQTAYRRSPVANKIIQQEIDALLDGGLIVPSNSPWSSLLLLINKKDGSNLVVIDYWKLNAISKKDRYPLPRIDDTLEKLSGAKFFLAMDLIAGYWQIPMQVEDQEKCAIITADGLYKPTRMPQGLDNATATFQRLMDTTFRDLKSICVLVYLEDINFYSKSFNEHLADLEKVFIRLEKVGLKLKPKKCQFFKDNLEFLGHVITKKGITPVPAKVEAIGKMAPPSSVKDLQCFLGMVGYYRRFIESFANLAQPMFRLLKKDVEFIWDKDCQAGFESLKQALMESPVLAYPDFSKEFILYTDVSLVAVGVVLAQLSDDGHDHPVAYFSRTLKTHERNYSVTERKCLAVLYGFEECRPYLYGSHFKVVADQYSLKCLNNLKDPEGLLAFWAVYLQDYN